jgi:lipoate-protein ligase A
MERIVPPDLLPQNPVTCPEAATSPSWTCRLLPFETGSGPHNMACDEAMLATAKNGTPCLRFYTWSEPTLSLGYFQPAAVRSSDPRWANLPFVRRPSGGAALVHHHELTYALAMPADVPHPSSWLARMHKVIAAALGRLGAPCELVCSRSESRAVGSDLCFRQPTAGDVLCQNAKIVGSAQRKHRHGLLQHGAILLARSPHAPEVAGILELSGRHLAPSDVQAAICNEWCRDTGWELGEQGWTLAEVDSTAELEAEKYANPTWSFKR